jgi:tetratricopeptide (TPR) repeat protein
VWNEGLLVVWQPNPEEKEREAKNSERFKLSFSEGHNNQGVEDLLNDRVDAAIKSFQLAIQMDSEIAAFHNNLGLAWLKQGKHAEAKKSFLKALAINEKFQVARFNYALACFLDQKKEEAYLQFRQAIALEPSLRDLAINAGDLYYERGELENAFQLWQEINRQSVLYELAGRRLRIFGHDEDV